MNKMTNNFNIASLKSRFDPEFYKKLLKRKLAENMMKKKQS